MKYDVVVVGAGPAGTVTARFAAELGVKVIIVERRQEIGIPVLCGEGVSRKIDAWNMLEGKRWIASSMDGARIYSPDGTMVKLSADMAGNETYLPGWVHILCPASEIYRPLLLMPIWGRWAIGLAASIGRISPA